MCAFRMKEQRGFAAEAHLLPKMSEAIFHYNGAPAHRVAWTQRCYQVFLPEFRKKAARSGNNPDLSSVENISTIVHLELDKGKPADSDATLVPDSQKAWWHFPVQLLGNLISGISESTRDCVCIHEKYICR